MSESALRLRFEVDWPQIRLVGRQTLEMRAPPPDVILTEEDARKTARKPVLSGYWIELRDGRGRPLYRRVLYDPLGTSLEAPTEDGSWTRVTVEQPSNLFSVVVPALPDAHSVALVGSPPGRPHEPARDLAVFDLIQHR
jgi:hypothetical protein